MSTRKIMFIVIALVLIVLIACVTFLSNNGNELQTKTIGNAKDKVKKENITFLRNMIGNKGYLEDVKFSPDSSKALTISGSSTIIWDIEGDKIIEEIEAPYASFNSNGKYIVSASINGSPRIWDSSNGKLLIDFEENYGSVTSNTFSTDDKYILTTSRDNNAVIWDATTHKALHILKGHTSNIYKGEFSQDGKYVSTASSDESAKIWDVKTGKMLHDLNKHHHYVYEAKFSPDTKHLITFGVDGLLRVWEVQTGKLIEFLNSSSLNNMISGVLSPDKKLAAVTKYGGLLELRDFETDKLKYNIKIGVEKIYYPHFSSDGNFIATESRTGDLSVWNAETGKRLNRFKIALGKVDNIVFTPNNKKIIVIYEQKKVAICEIKTGKILFEINDESYNGHTKLSPDGKLLSRRFGTNNIKIWDVETGKVRYELKGHKKNIRDLIFSNDSQYLVTGSADCAIKIWDLKTGKLYKNLNNYPKIISSHSDVFNQEEIEKVGLSDDNTTLFSTDYTNNGYVWDVNTEKVIRKINFNKPHVIQTISISEDNKQIIIKTEGIKNLIQRIDIETGALISEERGVDFYFNYIDYAEISPDGNYIVTANRKGNIFLYDANTYKLLKTLKGHKDKVNYLEFSSNSKYIISGSDDKTAIIWDIETGQKTDVLDNNRGPVRKVTFSPNGRYIISLQDADYPKLWKVNNDMFVAKKNNLNITSVKNQSGLNLTGEYSPVSQIDKIMKDFVGKNKTKLYLKNTIKDHKKLHQILDKHDKNLFKTKYVLAKYLPKAKESFKRFEVIDTNQIIQQSTKCYSAYSNKLTSMINNQRFELYIISAGESNFRTIHIKKSNKPIVLFINGASSLEWNFWDIVLEPGARLKKVYVSGNEYQMVRNLTKNNVEMYYVPNIKSIGFWEKENYERGVISNDFKNFNQQVREVTGLIEKSFQGGWSIKNFTIPYYNLKMSKELATKDVNLYDSYRYKEECLKDYIALDCPQALFKKNLKLAALSKFYETDQYTKLIKLITKLQAEKKLPAYIPTIFNLTSSVVPEIDISKIEYKPDSIYNTKSHSTCMLDIRIPNSVLINATNNDNIILTSHGTYNIIGNQGSDVIFVRTDTFTTLINPGNGNDYIETDTSADNIVFEKGWGNDVLRTSCRTINIKKTDKELKWDFASSLIFGPGIYPEDMVWIKNIYKEKSTGKRILAEELIKDFDVFYNKKSDKVYGYRDFIKLIQQNYKHKDGKNLREEELLFTGKDFFYSEYEERPEIEEKAYSKGMYMHPMMHMTEKGETIKKEELIDWVNKNLKKKANKGLVKKNYILVEDKYYYKTEERFIHEDELEWQGSLYINIKTGDSLAFPNQSEPCSNIVFDEN